MPPIRLISFGFLHLDGNPPPTADRVEDVRSRLRDPAAAREILDLDGRDARVQKVVLNTPGARELIVNLADYAASPAAPRTIAIGCAGGRHRAPALVELLAALLSERGLGRREVEIEHRHIHLPRVLTTEAEQDLDPYLALYDLDNQRRDYLAQDTGPELIDTSRRRYAMRETPAVELAAMAHLEFANRFAPHEALIPPRLPWVGYPLAEFGHPFAPHAVAYLGTPGFAGEHLFLTYRRYLHPELGSWRAVFELVDSSDPDVTYHPADLTELCSTIYGYQASYEAWCQDGTDTAGPYDDVDPYEYCDPSDLD